MTAERIADAALVEKARAALRRELVPDERGHATGGWALPLASADMDRLLDLAALGAPVAGATEAIAYMGPPGSRFLGSLWTAECTDPEFKNRQRRVLILPGGLAPTGGQGDDNG